MKKKQLAKCDGNPRSIRNLQGEYVRYVVVGKKHNDFNDSALHHVFHDENINPEFNTVIKDHMASYNYDNICNMTVHVKAYENYVTFK